MLYFAAPRLLLRRTARGCAGVVPSVLRPPVLWNADMLERRPARRAATLTARWRASSFAGCCFALVLVVVVSSAALFLTRLAPGDVTVAARPVRARARRSRATRARFDLDRSIARRSGRCWASRAVRLRLRRLVSLQPAGRAARRRAPRPTPRCSRVTALVAGHARRHSARHLHGQPPHGVVAGARPRRLARLPVAAAAPHVAAARVRRRAHAAGCRPAA